MGSGSVRPPGESGLMFDRILSRVQGESHKSRETEVEFHNLTGAMNDIHNTLSGPLVSFAFTILIKYLINISRCSLLISLLTHSPSS